MRDFKERTLPEVQHIIKRVARAYGTREIDKEDFDFYMETLGDIEDRLEGRDE